MTRTGGNYDLFTYGSDQMSYEYKYDAYGRMTNADFQVYQAHNGVYNARNEFKVGGNASGGGISFDENGNILNLKRDGYDLSSSYAMDNLSFTYASNSNQLSSVSDAVSTASYGDIETGSGGSYTHNSLGQLTASTVDGVTDVKYNSMRLVRKTTKPGSPNNPYVNYYYNANNDRIRIEEVNASLAKTTTWFVRDASGALFATYEASGSGTPGVVSYIGAGAVYDVSGDLSEYAISDHLGNTRAVINKNYTTSSGVTSWSDYYPFGNTLPGRSKSPEPSLMATRARRG